MDIRTKHKHRWHSDKCKRDEISQFREEFANWDIRSAQDRIAKIEHVIKGVNHPHNIEQHWKPSEHQGIGLLYIAQEHLRRIRFNRGIKPIVPEVIDFEHIPSLLRKRYADSWQRHEFTRDANDKQRELLMLDAVNKNDSIIEVLRHDNYINIKAVGVKNIPLGIIDVKENLIDVLMRLAPDQLDKNVTYDPEPEYLELMELEHKELMFKHYPEQQREVMVKEVGELTRPYSDALSKLRIPAEYVVSEHTIDTSTFTYDTELLQVLSKVNLCRKLMTDALADLKRITMNTQLNDLYIKIIERTRLFLKQRMDLTMEYLLLPSLPGEDTQYKVTITITPDEKKQYHIPSHSLSLMMFRSSSDKRNLRDFPTERCREFTKVCDLIKLFTLRLRKTITNQQALYKLGGDDRISALKAMTAMVTQVLTVNFTEDLQKQRERSIKQLQRAHIIHSQSILEMQLREGSQTISNFIAQQSLLIDAQQVSLMTTAEAVKTHPRHATLVLLDGVINLMKTPVLKDMLNNNDTIRKMQMRQVIVMKVELEWIVLQLPFPVTPWNCNKSDLKHLLKEHALTMKEE